MAAAAFGSVVEAATPRAACASVFRAWAVSLAAIPARSGIQTENEYVKLIESELLLSEKQSFMGRLYCKPNVHIYTDKRKLKKNPNKLDSKEVLVSAAQTCVMLISLCSTREQLSHGGSHRLRGAAQILSALFQLKEKVKKGRQREKNDTVIPNISAKPVNTT